MIPHLLLLVLATYATSLQVTKLGGPGGVFRSLRAKAKGNWKELIHCPICTGTWVSALLCSYACWLEWFSPASLPIWIFAVAGGNALLALFDPV